ncbi:MAG: hypothetical protein ACM3U1_05585 [Chloroflexota bacterium]
MRIIKIFSLYLAIVAITVIAAQNSYGQLTYPRQTVYAGISIDEENDNSNFFILGYMYEQSISPNFSALINTGLQFHSGDNNDNAAMIPMEAGLKVNFTRLQPANFFVMATSGVTGLWIEGIRGGTYLNSSSFGVGVDFSAATIMLKIGSVGSQTPISITAGYAF